MTDFRPEDREFFRSKVEPIRLKLLEGSPKAKAEAEKSAASKKKLDAMLWPSMGVTSDSYGAITPEIAERGWERSFKASGSTSSNVPGISGDSEVMSLAEQAAVAYKSGEYDKAQQINAEINTRIAATGAKAKGPILVGGFKKDSPLSRIGITALIPAEEGLGYRLVVIPRAGNGYGSPIDVSSRPKEEARTLTSLGENFTDLDYVNSLGPEAKQALDRALAERDNSMSPAPSGRVYRPRLTPVSDSSRSGS